MANDSELEQAVAALRREFAAALPSRLQALRAALEAVRHGGGASRETLQAFHLPAHALHGTAGAYDARELEPHVSRLATLARAWLNSGAAPSSELEEATRELEALARGVEQYQRRIAAGV